MGKAKIPTLIALTVLIVGIFIGVFFVHNEQFFRLGAKETISPKNVRLSNISDTSFTVSWLTTKPASSFVKWGDKKKLANSTLPQDVKDSTIHSITIDRLTENTSYYFKINSNGVDFDNNGALWQVKTARAVSNPNEAVVTSGSVVSQQGLPVAGAIVYITAGGSSLISTLTQEDGTFFVTLSNARGQTLDTFANIDSQNTLLEIFVQAGDKGNATAQAYPASANPLPPIKLGQTNDFKAVVKNEEIIPEVPFEFVEDVSQSPKEADVTLAHPVENEVFLTSAIEISGSADEDKLLTLALEPGNIEEKLSVKKGEIWSWQPTNRLKNGDYELTISWLDKDGVQNQIVGKFSVKTMQY